MTLASESFWSSRGVCSAQPHRALPARRRWAPYEHAYMDLIGRSGSYLFSGDGRNTSFLEAFELFVGASTWGWRKCSG